MPEWVRRCLTCPDPLYLRSVDSKSLLVQAHLFPAHTPIVTRALVDSGCSTRGFIDRSFTNKHNLMTYPVPYHRELKLADGTSADVIREYTLVPMAIGNHSELMLLFLTKLAQSTPVILGLSWLQRHNPLVDWRHMSLTFQSGYCRRHCNPEGHREVPAPVLPDIPERYHDFSISGEPQLIRRTDEPKASTNRRITSHRTLKTSLTKEKPKSKETTAIRLLR